MSMMRSWFRKSALALVQPEAPARPATTLAQPTLAVWTMPAKSAAPRRAVEKPMPQRTDFQLGQE
jgi:hypothetical protein